MQLASVRTRLPPSPGRGTMRSPELLVIGAGPYGLAVSAHAQRHGIDTVTVGAPMGFWREHMPAGMSLRSGPDWHLDVAGENTFHAFLAEKGITASYVLPFRSPSTWTTPTGSSQGRDCASTPSASSDWRVPATGSRPTWTTANRSWLTRWWQLPVSPASRSCRHGRATFRATDARTPVTWWRSSSCRERAS